MARLIDRVYEQIPPRLRGRLHIDIRSDPYYLRVDVVVTGADGVPYAAVLDNDWKIPDWFISHMCSIPVDDDSLNAQLWDSLFNEQEEAAEGPAPHRR
jgi:hypothetical protein